MQKKLGIKLRRLRGDRPASKVAAAVGCSINTLRQIEKGETTDPGFPLIRLLARQYRVATDWLGDDEKDWPPPQPPELETARQIRELVARDRAGDLSSASPAEAQIISLVRQLPDAVIGEIIAYLQGRVAEYARSAVAAGVKDAEAAELERQLRQAGREAEVQAAPPSPPAPEQRPAKGA